MFLNKENIQQHKDRASFSCLSPTYDTAFKGVCPAKTIFMCSDHTCTIKHNQRAYGNTIPMRYGTQDLAFQKFNLKTSPEDPISGTAILQM